MKSLARIIFIGLAILVGVLCIQPTSAGASEKFYAQGYIKLMGQAIDPATMYQADMNGDKLWLDPSVEGSASVRGRIKLFWKPVNWFSFETAWELNPAANTETATSGMSAMDITPNTGGYRVYDFRERIYPWSPDDNATFTLRHSLDRFVLNFAVAFADISIGRQPIAFGSAKGINPTDVLTPFTFSTIDKEERAGVDAIRIRFPIQDMSEIDIGYVLGNKGEANNSAAFIRGQMYVAETDFIFSAIWFRHNLLFGLDITRSIGGATVWLEAAYTMANVTEDYNPDQDYLRLSVGMDYNLADGWYLFMEYHYNMAGALWAEDINPYAGSIFNGILGMAPLKTAYGEGGVYLMGQHYYILGTSYQFTPLLTGNFQTMLNVMDPSALLIGSLSYSAADEVVLEGGVIAGVGKRSGMLADGTVDFGSEFGMYPIMYYLGTRVYF